MTNDLETANKQPHAIQVFRLRIRLSDIGRK
jgi:hypothetical protein